MEIITKSAEETKSLGSQIANSLIKKNLKKALFCLSGELGSGKTTFVQGFTRGLGIEQRIVSPTFILVRRYKIKTRNLSDLYHVDLYRLEGNLKYEIQNLGLVDLWKKEGSILLIEWAEKIKKEIPKFATWIKFEYVSDSERRITLENLYD